MLLSGSSGSGKTRWAYDLFRKDLELRKNGEGIFDKPFDRIIISYRQYQPLFDQFVQLFPAGVVEITLGMPWAQLDAIDGTSGQTACLIDDQMSALG